MKYLMNNKPWYHPKEKTPPGSYKKQKSKYKELLASFTPLSHTLFLFIYMTPFASI